MTEQNTICAVSTPYGTGGIGVVRISGPRAISVAQSVFASRSGRPLREAKGYTGMLGRIFDARGELDDAIAFLYRAPHSYTGEDVVELSCHGGMWIVSRVMQLCTENGAQPAAPGEFTKRAFLAGKMALSDAEAVADLIEAQGDAAMRAALSARDGALSTAIENVVESLAQQSAHLAAWADYPEEEMEAVEGGALSAALQCAAERISALLSTWEQGRIVREGIDTVIVGKPNVGKSTLMNLLTGQPRSIVTEIAGTTRDVVEDSVRLGDCVLRLADTAGLRETADVVERIGVQKAKERLQQAGLVLAVFDSSDPLDADDRALLKQLEGRPCVAVINKVDLPSHLDSEAIRAVIPRVVFISAVDGQGRDQLVREVSALLEMDYFDPTAAMVATERQRRALLRADDSLREALEALQSGMMLDAVSVSLDDALDALLELTGRKATEAVVNEVFSRFCVGK